MVIITSRGSLLLLSAIGLGLAACAVPYDNTDPYRAYGYGGPAYVAPYPGEFSSPFYTSPFFGAFALRGEDRDRGRGRDHDHDHDADRHHDADRGEHQLGGGGHGGAARGGQVAAAPEHHH